MNAQFGLSIQSFEVMPTSWWSLEWHIGWKCYFYLSHGCLWLKRGTYIISESPPVQFVWSQMLLCRFTKHGWRVNWIECADQFLSMWRWSQTVSKTFASWPSDFCQRWLRFGSSDAFQCSCAQGGPPRKSSSSLLCPWERGGTVQKTRNPKDNQPNPCRTEFLWMHTCRHVLLEYWFAPSSIDSIRERRRKYQHAAGPQAVHPYNQLFEDLPSNCSVVQIIHMCHVQRQSTQILWDVAMGLQCTVWGFRAPRLLLGWDQRARVSVRLAKRWVNTSNSNSSGSKCFNLPSFVLLRSRYLEDI